MLLFFLIGLCVGSFLNVLIDRLPRNESILGRSYCENCKKTLKPLDLIPIISFFYLKGKCRYCRSPLSYQYPLIEFLTGFLFVLTAFYFSSGTIFPPKTVQPMADIFQLIYYFSIVSCLVVVFFADLKYGIIPNKIIFPAIIFSLLFLIIFNSHSTLNYLFSGLGAFVFFLALYLLTKGRGMGFGDVKFAFLIGVFLGFPGTFFALYVAFLTGGLVGLILILWKKKKMKYAIPFGPFLVIGVFISLFFQNQLKSIIFPYF